MQARHFECEEVQPACSLPDSEDNPNVELTFQTSATASFHEWLHSCAHAGSNICMRVMIDQTWPSSLFWSVVFLLISWWFYRKAGELILPLFLPYFFPIAGNYSRTIIFSGPWKNKPCPVVDSQLFGPCWCWGASSSQDVRRWILSKDGSVALSIHTRCFRCVFVWGCD